jgi:hypothetical protein
MVAHQRESNLMDLPKLVTPQEQLNCRDSYSTMILGEAPTSVFPTRIPYPEERTEAVTIIEAMFFFDPKTLLQVEQESQPIERPSTLNQTVNTQSHNSLQIFRNSHESQPTERPETINKTMEIDAPNSHPSLQISSIWQDSPPQAKNLISETRTQNRTVEVDTPNSQENPLNLSVQRKSRPTERQTQLSTAVDASGSASQHLLHIPSVPKAGWTDIHLLHLPRAAKANWMEKKGDGHLSAPIETTVEESPPVSGNPQDLLPCVLSESDTGTDSNEATTAQICQQNLLPCVPRASRTEMRLLQRAAQQGSKTPVPRWLRHHLPKLEVFSSQSPFQRNVLTRTMHHRPSPEASSENTPVYPVKYTSSVKSSLEVFFDSPTERAPEAPTSMFDFPTAKTPQAAQAEQSVNVFSDFPKERAPEALIAIPNFQTYVPQQDANMVLDFQQKATQQDANMVLDFPQKATQQDANMVLDFPQKAPQGEQSVNVFSDFPTERAPEALIAIPNFQTYVPQEAAQEAQGVLFDFPTATKGLKDSTYPKGPSYNNNQAKQGSSPPLSMMKNDFKNFPQDREDSPILLVDCLSLFEERSTTYRSPPALNSPYAKMQHPLDDFQSGFPSRISKPTPRQRCRSSRRTRSRRCPQLQENPQSKMPAAPGEPANEDSATSRRTRHRRCRPLLSTSRDINLPQTGDALAPGDPKNPQLKMPPTLSCQDAANSPNLLKTHQSRHAATLPRTNC